MRSFVVISCVIVAVTAKPDVSLGYKYPQPIICSDSPRQFNPISEKCSFPTFVSASGSSFAQEGSLDVRFDPGSAIGTSEVSGTSGFSSGAFGSGSGSGFSGTAQQYYQTPIPMKHFYLYAAPEEPQDQVTKYITIGRPQKNYKVIFIKAPATNSVVPRISASFAPTEEKTIIYVLSKKPEDINISEVATPAPTEPSKPEVFFIKYKTAEEAAHAQQKIQAQYDALGGTSQFTDGGTAQVSSVIGSLGSGETFSSSKYLPPTH